MFRIFFGLIFTPVFGLMFIWFGLQRLLGALHGEKPVEAIIWGSFGIVLGIGAIALIVWLIWFSPDRSEEYRFVQPSP